MVAFPDPTTLSVSGLVPARRLEAARDTLIRLADDYPAAMREFQWPDVGDGFNFVHDWFDVFATGNDRPGLIIADADGSRTVHSFADLQRRSVTVGRQLKSLGISRGDSVMVMLGNQVELWETMLAIIRIGAVIVPATTALGAQELPERISRASVTAIIANAEDVTKFADVPANLTKIALGGAYPGWETYDQRLRDDEAIAHPGNTSDDRMLLYFTSGTTRRPKLVEHTHRSYPVGHLSTMYWVGLRPGDVHLNISSPGWAKHAWSSFFAPWLAEATIFVLNYSKFDAVSLLRILDGDEISSFCAPPTVWRMLINADLSAGKPRSLRSAVSAGEPLNPAVITAIDERWGVTIRDGFGQTECTASIANTPGQPLKHGSMGRPLPGVPVILVDPRTNVEIEGVGEGEVCIDLSRAPVSLMTGYVDDTASQDAAMAGGFYHTGDIASRDEEGYITFVGRRDDVFKSSDYKISPFELESVLISHPAVAEAAIVPSPDAVRLAVPKAYIALAPGHAQTKETARDILLFARENLAPFQRVRLLEFIDLPKTISGKIRRVELRIREESRPDRFEGEFHLDDFIGR